LRKQSVKAKIGLLESIADGVLHHQLNYSSGGASLIVVAPEGQARSICLDDRNIQPERIGEYRPQPRHRHRAEVHGGRDVQNGCGRQESEEEIKRISRGKEFPLEGGNQG
jgi:hypothetical protein